MIGTLPSPYPEELLYSLCARYYDRMQYPSKRSVVQDLFGSGNVIASVWLPSRLDEFVAMFPPGHHSSADDLIDNHTLLPFYTPFVLPERLQQLRQDMHGRNGPGIHMRIGNMASHVPLPEWLRLCSHCVEEDRKQYGECYWHRVHQVPGVEICPAHETRLQNSGVRARNVKTRYEFVSAEHAIRGKEQQLNSQSLYHQTLLHIARDIYWLLCQRHLSQDLKLLHRRYRKLLSERDLATYRGRVDISMFLQKFRTCYPPQLLQILHCELEEHIQEKWLLRLVRTPHSAQHPLHHLLLIHFLGYTVESFFRLPVERNPFGGGPWPCLNPVCSHYRQSHIKESQVVHSQYISGKPIGIFACTCGFVYTQTGSHTSGSGQFQPCKIKAFGSLWETRLRGLWEDETTSLRAIARQLGVDPRTVKRQASRIGLPFPRPLRRCSPLKVPQKSARSLTHEQEIATLEAYRTTWLATVRANPGASVNILRSKVPGTYTWLYRKDKTWLQGHTPPYEKKTKPQHQRVDWSERDSLLAEAVKNSASRLRKIPGRPVRVTRSTIGRDIGQLALIEQHLNELPLTAIALRDGAETREAFAIRRIQWAVEYCVKEHIYPVKWRLIRLAGVARLSTQPNVKYHIDNAMRLLSQLTGVGSNRDARKVW